MEMQAGILHHTYPVTFSISSLGPLQLQVKVIEQSFIELNNLQLDMPCVLVTGANGFLAIHLLKQLLEVRCRSLSRL